LIVAEPFRSGPTQFAKRLLGREPVPFPTSATACLVSPMRIRREDGHGSRTLERTYADYDQLLKTRAREMGLSSPAIITTNPYYAAHAPLDWGGPVTYYGWDDWAAWPTLRRWWPDLREAYRRISARGHRVCAVSRSLLGVIDPTGPSAVVPNGIEPSEWQPPWSEASWLESLPRPHILYIGAIHSRLDIEAVGEISRAFPNGSVIFVGPVIDREVVTQLSSMRNVHIRDPLPRREIAGLVHSADVCIMPHRRTDLTKSMSPLKLYEYCAAGRPSAATDLPPVRGIDPAVRLVSEGSSFAEGVLRALQAGPMSEDKRQEFLKRNSWEQRHKEILELALAGS